MADTLTPATTQARNGGFILVDALRRNGVDTVYCVPGESYLPVLDALHDTASIRTIVTRHEGAASNMADAYGKLTGRPGICFVTRGPGATHAANGVHTARQDSTPMILFIGQVERAAMGREGFQEMDYRQMFGGEATKWVTEIDDAARIPEIVSRAFAVAMSGRPGPVVVALPEDVMFATAPLAPAPAVRIAHAAPDAAAIAEIGAMLAKAKQPLVILGGTGWDEAGSKALARFVDKFNLPVAASFRRQDLFDNRDPHYAGQLGLGTAPALTRRVQESDLLLVIGSRLSETVSAGYTLIQSPKPAQPMIHIHPDPQELGRVYQAELPVLAGLSLAAKALAELPAPASVPWGGWTQAANADYRAHSTPQPNPEIQGVDLAQVIGHLNQTLPDNATIANGAGNYTVWVHRYYRYRQPRTALAPTNGAMGYGFPAAVAAKLQDRDRISICVAGDGCFMMYAQELATAVQFNAPLIVLLVNNNMLGTIRMHQEREYPGRVSATDLHNPDFVALAKAYGAHAELVEATDAFPAAFARALAAGKPALIELRTDPKQITPTARLA
ncbi:thiamine pyrophosphate-binding protein [Acidocella facilis]|uniref:thiamine pyrophosphate-binding protein n=1 Tax=Acidocella facilis TaxID=525 RepID=UPI001F33F47F|nr:thiamine pyrophosphate-binding protein [Acidocella facilis]